MRPDDASAVARLATQLGYASTEAQLANRIAQLSGREDVLAMVAEDGGRVVAWVHVELRRSLVAERGAQIMGLVVDEACRGQGIGAALVRESEGWARNQHATEMRIGSRISRTDAHRFYERERYGLAKTTHIFEKELS